MRIEEYLSQLRGARYLTSLDSSSAYHKIPMAPADTYKTAFKPRYGHSNNDNNDKDTLFGVWLKVGNQIVLPAFARGLE